MLVFTRAQVGRQELAAPAPRERSQNEFARLIPGDPQNGRDGSPFLERLIAQQRQGVQRRIDVTSTVKRG